MKILLHMCCGPCSIYPLSVLLKEEHNVQGFFYNPNIHPYKEFERRLTTLKEYAQAENIPLIVRDEYNFEDYLRKVVYDEARRCMHCYEMRLRETAKLAKDEGFEAFTTTLLVSPYQKHELIKKVGEEASQEYNIPFLYIDLRPGYKEATNISREKQMYRQPYCGCIYSEKERYYRGRN